MQKLSFACWRWYHCNVAVAPPAGPHLRGALPCRAPLQPWCQRCRGGGERTDRLRLQARLCRGSTTGRITSKHRHRVSVLCRQLNVFSLLLLCSCRTGRNRRTPAAWRTSHGMRPTVPCHCLSQSPFRGGPRSYAITRLDPWRWGRLIHLVVQRLHILSMKTLSNISSLVCLASTELLYCLRYLCNQSVL